MSTRIDVGRDSRYSLPQIPVLVAIANPRTRRSALKFDRGVARAAGNPYRSISLRLTGAWGAVTPQGRSQHGVHRRQTAFQARLTASLRDATHPNRYSQDGVRCVPHRTSSWAKFTASLRDALAADKAQRLPLLPRAGRMGRFRRNATLQPRPGGQKNL
jgi:hypothetical protein